MTPVAGSGIFLPLIRGDDRDEPMHTRRELLKTAGLGALGLGAGALAAESLADDAVPGAKTPAAGVDSAQGASDGAGQTASTAEPGCMPQRPQPAWARGIENQRRADLGDGRYLNPIVSGDRPDPSIVKDDDDYYMTFSSFEAYPGLLIWHSRDLLNWQPIGPALTRNIGSVWAPELIKHQGRFYIYLPTKQTAAPGSKTSSWVIYADDIRGPWSEPIDLDLPNHIDPGHAVGEDGSRWLFLSGGDRVRLADDGLSRIGEPEHVHDPWRYPPDWVVEAFAPEGPKITRRGEYFYLITAVGGTAGPPTGHMVIAARDVDPRAVGAPSAQPAGAHSVGGGTVVVARPRHPGGRSERRLVGRLPRLRERLLDAGPAVPAGARAVERGRLVRLRRR